MIWKSPRLGVWDWVPGWLTTLVAGDFDGDGIDDVAGIAGETVWFTLDLRQRDPHWQGMPGVWTLEVDRSAPEHDDLVGWNGYCWRMQPLGQWQNEACGAH